jgi:hypothetical protein
VFRADFKWYNGIYCTTQKLSLSNMAFKKINELVMYMFFTRFNLKNSIQRRLCFFFARLWYYLNFFSKLLGVGNTSDYVFVSVFPRRNINLGLIKKELFIYGGKVFVLPKFMVNVIFNYCNVTNTSVFYGAYILCLVFRSSSTDLTSLLPFYLNPIIVDFFSNAVIKGFLNMGIIQILQLSLFGIKKFMVLNQLLRVDFNVVDFFCEKLKNLCRIYIVLLHYLFLLQFLVFKNFNLIRAVIRFKT